MSCKEWKAGQTLVTLITFFLLFLAFQGKISPSGNLSPRSYYPGSLNNYAIPAWSSRIKPPDQPLSLRASFSPFFAFSQVPAYFIPNKGQFASPVEFALQNRDRVIFFSAKEVSFLLAGENGASVVKVKFLDSRPGARPLAEGKPEASFSYFQGGPGDWKTGVPGYNRIRYTSLWPGIDLVYSSSPAGLKSEFIVHPGADPAMIRLAIQGVRDVCVDEEGRLVMATDGGEIVDEIPKAYQIIEGKRVGVRVSYEIYEKGADRADSAFIYGFTIDPYDPSEALILDPMIMIAGSYLGGPSFDYAYGIALDSAGHVYVAGYTYSASHFPLYAGPQLKFNGGEVDAYVAKFDPSTSRLEYCGFIGGDDRDFAYGLTVDEEGNAYVAGYTASTEKSFPVFKGPDLTANGLYDVFVAKINPAGTRLEYCGFIGGADNDFGRGIAVDQEGRAYVVGYTLSNEVTFPVKKGPDLTYNGNYDAFIARVSASGEALEYCGYVGGNGNDYAYGVAVDPQGGAYITGSTNSPESTLQVTAGPDLSFNGLVDAYVAKVSASGESLDYCGYIGGSGEDVATAITVDPSGCAYLTGYTASAENSFPVTFGPDLSYNGGSYDAFVAKVWPDGTRLVYCGYIGGSEYEAGTGVAVDDWGCAYVTGYTSSDANSFPVKEGPDLNFHRGFDAFLAKVASDGHNLDFCGYLGGAEADLAQAVVVEKAGSGIIYIAGSSYSSDLGFPASLAAGLSFGGKRDAFLARYYETSITLTAPNGGEIWHSGFEQNITWRSVGEMGPVRLELSTDKGTTWGVIVEETENDGVFTWVVPDLNSTSCLIRISEADDGIPSDTSDGPFVITNEPVIVVISPNGGEKWPVGSTQEIRWSTGSTAVGDVRLEYSIDNGLNWIEIVSRTENDGIYEWVIPDTVSSECLVKISEADDGDPADVSDAPFSIVESDSSTFDSPKSRRAGDILLLKKKEEISEPGKKNSVKGGSR